MKRTATVLFAGLFFYAIFLVATIPAAFINVVLAHYGGKTLHIDNTQGTVWQGAGNLYGMEDVRWKVVMPELLLGRLHIKIASSIAHGSMDVFISPARIETRHLVLLLPAALLSELDPALKSMAPGGQLRVSTEQFSVSKAMHGELDLEWLDASSSLSRVAPVGNYLIHISAQGRQADLKLDTQKGPLFLSGNGNWSPSAGLSFTGAAISKNEQLAGLLKLIGRPSANGSYQVKIGGKS
ncbi:MAG TPA: type II secretion system protein N [Burkholderiales bacterium]|nr:type II secretion system protein N [Burkholderiales bacterium]